MKGAIEREKTIEQENVLVTEYEVQTRIRTWSNEYSLEDTWCLHWFIHG